MEIQELTEILHGYLDRGWNIFPVESMGKRPVVVSSGIGGDGEHFDVRLKWAEFQYNRVTKEMVTKWAEQYPDCNWAVVCGKISNLCVVDIDGVEGVKSIREHHPELEKIPTLCQKTPNGIHMFFSHPGNPVKSFPILTKVDVKGDGGYVVLPPSKTINGEYKFATKSKIASCPGWVARGERTGEIMQNDNPISGEARPAWVSNLLAGGSPSGRRNADAARLVGYFWNRNVGKDIIEQVISPWAERCQPPLEIRELRSVIRSVCSYQQMAKSRGVIDPPVMTSTGVGWRFTWDEFQISIEVSRLVESTRYGIVGEVEVRTNNIPSLPKYLYGPIDYSFKDARSQSALITELDKRMHGPPWSQILTDFSRIVIAQFTKGNEWQLLREAPRAVAQGYAYKPLLLAKEPTLWFSAGGGMKSYLALMLGTMMETGLDFGIGPSLVRNHVAYLDWEWDVGQHAKRLDAIISPEEQERCGVNILYRHCGGRPLRAQISELKRMIAEEGITYIIIDSASPACGRASDNDEIVAFFQAISELRVGALVLAHVTKYDRQSEDVAATAFGGVQWENQARSTWNLKKIQEEGSNVAHLVLSHQKVNGGMLHTPVCFKVDFPAEDDDTGRVMMQLANPGEIPMETTGPASVSARDQIRMALKTRPMTIEDLADTLHNVPEQVLISTLRAMESKSLIRTVRAVNGEMKEVWGLRTVAS